MKTVRIGRSTSILRPTFDLAHARSYSPHPRLGGMSDEDATTDRVGQVLGGYRVERLIAMGGMASVWSARHITRGTEAVAKVHEADLADARDPASRERFLREATALVQVRHRNVVELFEVGETEHGEPYLIIEKLEGEALDERLLRGRTTTSE